MSYPHTLMIMSYLSLLLPLNQLVSSHNNVFHFIPNSSSGHNHPYTEAFTHDCSVWNAPPGLFLLVSSIRP